MDIRQLRYFLRICSDGSILKASQNVFITQQALSKIISAMEQEIGAPLMRELERVLMLRRSSSVPLAAWFRQKSVFNSKSWLNLWLMQWIS